MCLFLSQYYLRISPYLSSKGEGDRWKILGGSHGFQGGTEGICRREQSIRET